MTKIKILAWLMVSLGIHSCKTYQPDNLPETQLRFGQGGGYTGALTEYLLLENGQVFVRSGLEGTLQPLGKIKKARAKSMFKSWTAQSFSEEAFQHPGNMYYYVNMVEAGKEHQLTWGSHDHPVSDSLQAFYQSCNTMIKEIKETKEKESKSGS